MFQEHCCSESPSCDGCEAVVLPIPSLQVLVLEIRLLATGDVKRRQEKSLYVDNREGLQCVSGNQMFKMLFSF